MNTMSKPVRTGLTIALGVLLAGAVIAGLLVGDDWKELFSRSSSSSERVQLQGYWMGMTLANADSPPDDYAPTIGAKGVRVVDISERNGWRPRATGLMPGDVIVSIGGKKVENLSDLDRMAQKMDTAGPLPFDVLRYGQPLTLTMSPLAVAQGQVPGMPQAAVPPIAQSPIAPLSQQQGPVMPGPATPQAAALAPAAGQPAMFYCPRHRSMWPQQQVHPGYRCPLCYGPLSRAQ
jgi:hypothetical protein